MVWNGMEWYGMGWTGMEWYGMVWNGMEYSNCVLRCNRNAIDHVATCCHVCLALLYKRCLE